MLYMKQKIDRKIHSKRNHCYNLNKTYRLFFNFYQAFFAPLFESRITVAGFPRRSLDLKLLHSASEKFNMPYE